MDTNEIKERIFSLDSEIEKILEEAGSPKHWSRDYGAEVADVIARLSYIHSAMKSWRMP